MAATRSAWASSRTSAVTSWPCSCSSVSMCDPMKPVEPVSVTFIIRHPPVLIVRAARGELGAASRAKDRAERRQCVFPIPFLFGICRLLPLPAGDRGRCLLDQAGTPASGSRARHPAVGPLGGRVACPSVHIHLPNTTRLPTFIPAIGRQWPRRPPADNRPSDSDPAEAGWLTCAELIEHMVGTGTALVTDGERPARATARH